MKPLLYRREGRPEVYLLGKLIHIKDQADFITRGYKPEDVRVLPDDDPIWEYPVEYSRVPDELKR